MRQLCDWVVIRVAFFFAATGIALAANVAAQDQHRDPHPQSARRFQPPGGHFATGSRMSAADYRDQLVKRWKLQLESATGFLFVDCQYIPPPYKVELVEDQVVVNGVGISCRAHGGDLAAPFQARWGPRPFQAIGDRLTMALQSDGFVIALPDEPLVVLSNASDQQQLLRLLGAKSATSLDVKNVSATFPPPDIDVETWNEFVRSFERSPAFLERAGEVLALFDEAARTNMAEVAASHRLQYFAYPLSMLGMIGTVAGFGHLLTHRPPVGRRPLETDASPMALQVLYYSLALVVLYSALDLAWTILAHQAGQMIEVNPLGSRFIDDPWQLIAFKVGATGVAVGLLLALRKYCRAQLAAWWICLVLTLLTARWLMMGSLIAV